MKVLFFNRLNLLVSSFSADLKTSYVMIKDNKGTIRKAIIPTKDITSRRNGLPLPEGYLNESGLPLTEHWYPVVELVLEGGRKRLALDETKFEEIISDDVRQLLTDMKNEEHKMLEFKASCIFPPSPDDPSDHAFQMREIIKQCQAFANSTGHRGRLYIGVQDKRGTRTVVGIQDEFKEVNPSCTPELFRSYFMNTLKQMTGEALLLATNFKYIEYQGKTVIRLDVAYSGDVVLFGKNRELNVRLDSSMHRIDEVSSYINFIRNFR